MHTYQSETDKQTHPHLHTYHGNFRRLLIVRQECSKSEVLSTLERIRIGNELITAIVTKLRQTHFRIDTTQYTYCTTRKRNTLSTQNYIHFIKVSTARGKHRTQNTVQTSQSLYLHAALLCYLISIYVHQFLHFSVFFLFCMCYV